MAMKVLVEDSSKQSKMGKKVFLLSGFNPREKEELHRKILQLGGHSKIAEDIYVTECSYVIVPNSWKDKWTTIVMVSRVPLGICAMSFDNTHFFRAQLAVENSL